MATNVRIVYARDFIRAKPEGQIDLEKSKQLLLEIASVAGPSDDFEIVIDTRKAQITMSVTDLWFLAKELDTFQTTFSRKTAVLCPLERFDQAKFFALCAQNRDYSVRAFVSYEDAIEWLIANRS